MWADSRPDTMNIDEHQVEHLITDRTKAIVVVHYGGIACEMNHLSAIADRYGIPLVEDNAHGLGGRYHGKSLGSFGVFATQSFHETKNLSSGEGGALVINEPAYIERAEIIREKGTNRSQFWRGKVDKYTWIDIGSSFLPSEITAALLLAQFDEIVRIQSDRERVWRRYQVALRECAERNGFQLPVVPPGCEPAFHLFSLVLGDVEERVMLQKHLRDEGILAVSHYVPLHSSPYGSTVGRGECPQAEDVSQRLLRLPFYTDMTNDEIEMVVNGINGCYS